MRPYVWMLLGAISFASMGALAHALHGAVDWQVIALARASVPLLLTAAAALGGRVRLVFWRPKSLWTRSLAGSVSLVCAFYALTHLPIADALTLTNLYPVWIALLSWPLLGAAPTWGMWLAIATGIVGVALVQQPHLAEGNLATLAALASSFTSAVAMIGLHRLRGVDVRAVVFHFSAISCVACVFALAAFEREVTTPPSLDAMVLLMLVGTGLAATLGQVFITLAFATGVPAKISVVGLTQVGFGMIFDVLFWQRRFELISLAGIALVIAPTAWLLLARPAAAGISPHWDGSGKAPRSNDECRSANVESMTKHE